MTKAIKYRPPVHPGVILKIDLLDALGMSINRLAKELRVPANRLSQIVHGRHGITPDTSLRLGRYFGFSPEYWLNMQTHFDLEIIRRQSMRKIEREIKPREAAQKITPVSFEAIVKFLTPPDFPQLRTVLQGPSLGVDSIDGFDVLRPEQRFSPIWLAIHQLPTTPFLGRNEWCRPIFCPP